MATLFSGHHIGVPRRAPMWRFHTGFSKFLRNISTNILSLGKRTDLNLGEVSSFFICHNIAISWLYPLDGFQFIFFYWVTGKTIRMAYTSDSDSEGCAFSCFSYIKCRDFASWGMCKGRGICHLVIRKGYLLKYFEQTELVAILSKLLSSTSFHYTTSQVLSLKPYRV